MGYHVIKRKNKGLWTFIAGPHTPHQSSNVPLEPSAPAGYAAGAGRWNCPAECCYNGFLSAAASGHGCDEAKVYCKTAAAVEMVVDTAAAVEMVVDGCPPMRCMTEHGP